MLVIDPLTGQIKGGAEAGPPPTQQNGQVHLCQSSPLTGPVYCINSQYVYFDGFGNLIVAGDGYAYVPYSYRSLIWPPVCIPNASGSGCALSPPCASNSAFTGTDYLNLLRIDTAGNASSIPLGSWNISGDCYGGTYAAPTNANVITNADQGTLVTWQLDTGTQGSAGQSKQTTYYIAITSGTGVVSQNTMPKQITPVLHAQDGTFFGTSDQGGMVRFDRSGNIKWSVGDSPQIATADNGVVGASGTTYDSGGNATGQIAMATFSWKGAYQDGPAQSVADPIPTIAPVYAAVAGGSPTGKGTAVAVHSIGLFWCGATLSGTCKGLTDANNIPESDLGFTYLPANCHTTPPQNCPNLQPQDFTSNAAWVNLIMSQAKQAVTAAFKGVPIVPPQHHSPIPVSRFGNPTGTPDHVVNIVGTINVSAKDGVGVTTRDCTFGLFYCSWNSVVYYTFVMNQAQTILPNLSSPAYPPQTSVQRAAFQNLLTAIGKGIGNTAAHELGHQFLLPDMDCDTSAKPNLHCDPPNGSNVGLLYESEDSAAAYLDIGGDLTWDLIDMPVLTQELFKTSPNSN